MALIEEFNIGFAPNERSFLRKFLNEKAAEFSWYRTLCSSATMAHWRIAFTRESCFRSKSSGENDWFFWSVVSKRKVGDQDQPKYLNSPETILFNKRRFFFSTLTKRDERCVKMVKCIIWRIYGRDAALGKQDRKQSPRWGPAWPISRSLIERVAQVAILCYDGDSAGVEATNRGIDLLQNNIAAWNYLWFECPGTDGPRWLFAQIYRTEAFIN